MRFGKGKLSFKLTNLFPASSKDYAEPSPLDILFLSNLPYPPPLNLWEGAGAPGEMGKPVLSVLPAQEMKWRDVNPLGRAMLPSPQVSESFSFLVNPA